MTSTTIVAWIAAGIGTGGLGAIVTAAAAHTPDGRYL